MRRIFGTPFSIYLAELAKVYSSVFDKEGIPTSRPAGRACLSCVGDWLTGGLTDSVWWYQQRRWVTTTTTTEFCLSQSLSPTGEGSSECWQLGCVSAGLSDGGDGCGVLRRTWCSRPSTRYVD